VKIGILARGAPETRQSVSAENHRHRAVFAALSRLGVAAEPVVYADEIAEEVRNQLLALDGVLIWVDPISNGQDRTTLDALLREVTAKGIWVSAHPDVILKMGTKDVLLTTKSLGWGTETFCYRTPRELHEQFPARLTLQGPRVLKQHRGNGGNGVWKVELLSLPPTIPGSADKPLDVPGPRSVVRVLHALRDSVEEELTLGAFMERCHDYFAGVGHLIDQPFQERLPEGMIRCYLSQDEVVGFGQQIVRALMPAPPDRATDAPQPGPRIMYPASESAFQPLRLQLETDWVPKMCRLLDIERRSLPVIWDADFLYGPKTRAGDDTFVLCEINVSSVAPFPDEAVEPLARNAVSCVRACAQP
jgi:hypothetical protein